MTFSLKKTILFVTVLDETIQSSTLCATPKTPSPPTTLTPGSGNFTFPMTSTQLVLNQGTIDASGTTAYHQDCGATPITTSMQTGDGTLTFNKTADTLAKVVYSINLKVPVSFSKDITTGTVSIPVIGGINYTVNMTGSGTMDANTGSITQTFTNGLLGHLHRRPACRPATERGARRTRCGATPMPIRAQPTRFIPGPPTPPI